ncbi:transposase [Streptomyces halstedii]|uniref:transposase n=1 Tax=Streptomyces halstedii TaxID=1944 RepID=UPI003865CA52
MIEDDHVYLLVHCPPKVQLSKLVNSLKGVLDEGVVACMSTSASDPGARCRRVCQKRGVTGVVEGYWRAAERRPSKVISKAFRAVFQRMVQRAWPLPVGSSDMIAM